MSTPHSHSLRDNSHEAGQDSARKTPIYDVRSALRIDLIRGISDLISAHALNAESVENLKEGVRFYNQSIGVLRTIRNETEALIECLCQRHFVADGERQVAHRHGSFSTAITSDANKESDFLALDAIRVSVNLEPGLFGLSVVEGTAQLAEDLTRTVEEFVDNFLRVLDRLVEVRVLGTIEWPVPTACRFRFFETKIDVTGEQPVTRIVSRDGQSWQQERRETEMTHTLHGRQQHLADARRIELQTYQGSMPIRVRELCDAIPTWLEDRIDIVDGDLFRSDHVEQHLRSETQSELLQETKVPYHQDPALVMGPYVLAIWLPQEVDAEHHAAHRQSYLRHVEVDHQQASVRQDSYKPLLKVAGLQLIPLVLQFVAILVWPALHMIAIGVALLLLIPLLLPIRKTAIAHGLKPSSSIYLLAFGGTTLTVVAVHVFILAFGYSSLPLALMAFLLAGIGIWLLRELVVVFQVGTTKPSM